MRLNVAVRLNLRQNLKQAQLLAEVMVLRNAARQKAGICNAKYKRKTT
jgi:hypothetical protein